MPQKLGQRPCRSRASNLGLLALFTRLVKGSSVVSSELAGRPTAVTNPSFPWALANISHSDAGLSPPHPTPHPLAPQAPPTPSKQGPPTNLAACPTAQAQTPSAKTGADEHTTPSARRRMFEFLRRGRSNTFACTTLTPSTKAPSV